MDLLNLMREITAFILLIQWKTSDSTSHSIDATCQQQSEDVPDEWYSSHHRIPSPLHDLTAELSEAQSSLTVRWAINVDVTNRDLTGTWISWSEEYYNTRSSYRCEYKPKFSDQISLAGLQQLWFSFTVLNVSVCPSNKYEFSAYNLPTPDPGTDNHLKEFSLKAAEIQWNADISSVLHDDKIVVSFNVSSVADRHTIQLENPTGTLQTVEIKEGCNVEKCQVELKYTGPCEDLTIRITSHFEHCMSRKVQHKVNCTNRSALAIGVGCVLALLSVLLCCCIACQMLRWVRGSKRGVSVRVLLVYPAVDGVFQRAVMLLAQSLQSRAGVTVVIDVWDRGSLAEQGPLRWINTQAELADKVLIITPPQTADDLKSKLVPGVSDDMVSASASSLFALALNLVSSAAREPLGRDKFWVVNLRAEDQSARPELRGLRRFLLPRDSEKLHQKLQSCFSSFNVRSAFEKMEIHTDLLTCAQDNSQDQTPHLLP